MRLRMPRSWFPIAAAAVLLLAHAAAAGAQTPLVPYYGKNIHYDHLTGASTPPITDYLP